MKNENRLELVGKFKTINTDDSNKIKRTYHLFENKRQFGNKLLVRVSQTVIKDLKLSWPIEQEIFWTCGDPIDSLKIEIPNKYKKLKYLVKELKK